MEYTEKQIEEWKLKAQKWDNLGAEIDKCYVEGIYDDEGNGDEAGIEADLCTVGELAASAFGWL